MNKVMMHGRLAKDVDLRTTTTGKSVASFTIAVDSGYGENRKADFFPCVAWGKTAELMSKHFSKGKEILIADGRLQNRSYDANDGSKRYVTEIIVNEVEFCGSKPDSGKKAPNDFAGQEVPADDIPF
jgi:single-strand DNA-binding protein